MSPGKAEMVTQQVDEECSVFKIGGYRLAVDG
jgi:hypothetical protein